MEAVALSAVRFLAASGDHSVWQQVEYRLRFRKRFCSQSPVREHWFSRSSERGSVTIFNLHYLIMQKKFFSHIYLGLTCLLASVIFLSGCAQNTNPDGRLDVTGRITFNGEPLRGSAFIRFDPTGEDTLAGGGGRINAQGNFHLTGQDGVKPGTYIVRITAVDTFDRLTDTWRTAETPDGREYTVRIVPREYNENSTIEFEVVEGRRNVFNYNIVSDAQPERVQ